MKNKDLVLLDLFSGTGGFHKGLSEAGFDLSETYYSEIDKHAIANYKYNFPNAKHIGSVEHILKSGIIRPNIITFGSPCQDFSLAGKRAGLDGARSGLIQKAITAITHFRPDLFIWENVKGTFSSNAGADFWAIIQAFANIGGYRLEWQLVNTSWLLPQNRERIYLVGHLTTSFRDLRSVFPIGENEGLFVKQRKAEQRQSQTENCTTIKVGYGGKADDTYILTRGRKLALNGVIQINSSTESNGKQPYQHNRMYDADGISPCLDADSRSPIIKAVLTPNRKEKRQNGRRMKENGEPSFTLTAQDQHGVFDGTSIRRLTEIECERLQGYPDNWTLYGNYDGVIKEISKTQRYKLLGNAVTAKMVQLIGTRIKNNIY